jgi:ParB family chromosome partitioning protein
MRLLALSDEIKQSLAAGTITEGHGRALLAIEIEADRRNAWKQVIERGLTVRQTERLARNNTNGSRKPAANGVDPEIDRIESRIRDTLGTKVELRRQKNGRGQLVLHFFSDDELNGLLSRIGVASE